MQKVILSLLCYQPYLSFAVLLLLVRPSSAVVLDWDGSTFDEGVLVQTFETDASNPGDDVRITFSQDTGQFIEFGGQEAPSVGDTLGDGTDPNPDALELIVNFEQKTERIRVLVEFLYADGVTDVSIPFFDVDVGTVDAATGDFVFTDQIRRVRTTTDGVQTANLNLTSFTTLNTGTNSFSNGGLAINGIASTDNDSSGGNFVLNLASATPINSFSFEYRNRQSTTIDDPSNQGIGLGNITYNPVIPEPNATWFVGLIAFFFAMFRRRKLRL